MHFIRVLLRQRYLLNVFYSSTAETKLVHSTSNPLSLRHVALCCYGDRGCDGQSNERWPKAYVQVFIEKGNRQPPIIIFFYPILCLSTTLASYSRGRVVALLL